MTTTTVPPGPKADDKTKPPSEPRSILKSAAKLGSYGNDNKKAHITVTIAKSGENAVAGHPVQLLHDDLCCKTIDVTIGEDPDQPALDGMGKGAFRGRASTSEFKCGKTTVSVKLNFDRDTPGIELLSDWAKSEVCFQAAVVSDASERTPEPDPDQMELEDAA